MKTFVIISPGFPANEADTTCLPSQQIFIRALNNIFPGLKIIIFTLQYPFYRGEYQWNGNTVISFNGLYWKYIRRPLLWLKVYKKLVLLHKTSAIDGILSFWCSETALIGKFFSSRHNVTHRCWVLGQDARKQNHFVRWINPTAEELIALSPFLQKEFAASHRVRPKHLIPNGIQTALFKSTGSLRDIDILGVGSLIPLKQYDVFIGIIQQLKKHQPGIKAVLCGKGPEEEKLSQRIKDLDLEQNIVLTGELSHEKTLETMQRAKVLLHPSSYEGYSTVCLEALYAGCHVVSFWFSEERPVRHWYVVKDQEEMMLKCLTLLQEQSLECSPVLVHRMEDSAEEMMKLFGYNREITS